MNSENITTGGFYNSYMYNTTLPKYLTGYKNAYGSSHILSFGHLISDVTKDDITAPGCGNWKGGSIDWSWYTTQITLMSEVHVYGSRIWGGGYDQGEACSQLAAFKHNAQLIHFQNGSFWLRAVTGNSNFAGASSDGHATSNGASYVLFVRPLVLIF